MELIDKEVRFDIFCERCKYKNKSEQDDPCYECLQYPSNEHSKKPVNFEEGS